MATETPILEFLQAEIKEYHPAQHQVRVETAQDGKSLLLAYHTVYHTDYGTTRDDLPILHLVSMPEWAPRFQSITLSAEDKGRNGTQNWEIKSMVEGAVFQRLTSLHFPLNTPTSHNGKIVTYHDSYDENGGLALLLDKCPRLETLAAPSAPNARFFEREAHPLRTLHIQAGFDHQGFVEVLSRSRCFPALEELTFRDYAETYMDDYASLTTPYAAYAQLMGAQGLPSLRRIVLHGTVLDDGQKASLAALAAQHGRQLEFKELTSA